MVDTTRFSKVQFASEDIDPDNDTLLVRNASQSVEERYTPREILEKSYAPQTIESRSADFTISATELGKTIEFASGGAGTITVPSNANVNLPVGFYSTVVQADGNKVTFSEQSGVTIRNNGGLSTNGQWSAATIYKRATDEWVLVGDLS